MKTNSYKLGNVLQDMVSGFKGVALVRIRTINGQTEYWLGAEYNPELGKTRYAIFEDTQLKFVGDKTPTGDILVEKGCEWPRTPLLGMTMQDKVTKFTGICVGLEDHLDGRCRVQIRPAVGTDGKYTELHSFDLTNTVVLEGTTPASESVGPARTEIRQPAMAGSLGKRD